MFVFCVEKFLHFFRHDHHSKVQHTKNDKIYILIAHVYTIFEGILMAILLHKIRSDFQKKKKKKKN